MAEPNTSKMLYRRVGNSGLHVSVISLGGWLTYGGHVDEEGTMKCMKQAYDLGINFFDTAESYAAGESEIAMGKVIKKLKWKRNDLVISTKVNFGTAHGDVEINNYGLSRKHIIEGTMASLKRLELDYVDIIFAHRPDRLTPMEEVVRAFNYLIEKGMAFYWGTSMWSADEIAEATGVAKALGLIGPIVEQPLYNVIDRQKVEGEYQRVLARCRIGLTVFSPLKGGILTGKYNEAAAEPPKGTRIAVSTDKYTSSVRKDYGNEAWNANIQKVAKLKTIADRLGCKVSAFALAWCLKNDNVCSVITGASRPEQVVENVESLKVLPKLTPEILAEVDELLGNKPQLDPARVG
ncbi:K+ channel protein [Histoplasma ohiense]|nr:K+ channel protein [Histoplasma ohiense (nom. inval.)]